MKLNHFKLIILLIFSSNIYAQSNFDFTEYCNKQDMQTNSCFKNFKTKESFENNLFQVLNDFNEPKMFKSYNKNIVDVIKNNGKILEEYNKKIFSEKSKLENFEKFSNIIDNSIKYSDKKIELLDIKTELYLSILKKIDKSKINIKFNEKSYLSPFYKEYKDYISNHSRNNEKIKDLIQIDKFDTILNKEYNHFFKVVFEDNTDVQMLKYRYELNFIDSILFYIKMYLLKIYTIDYIQESFYQDLLEQDFQKNYIMFNNINNNLMEIDRFLKKRN